MAKFPGVSAKTPTSIGDVTISIREGADQTITANYQIEVLDQDGNILSLERGDLLTIADAGSQATLASELASLRSRANSEMLV